MRKPTSRFSDEIRQAIDGCGLSRYRICLDLNIDQGQLSRFMTNRTGMSINMIDRLAKYLDLHVVVGNAAQERITAPRLNANDRGCGSGGAKTSKGRKAR